MKRPQVRPAALLALALAVAIVVPAASASGRAPSKATKGNAFVTSSDGTQIAITWFRPAGATRVPVILAGHGWSGSRMKEFNSGIIGDVSVKDLLKAGYGVVSIDARGHGDSGGRAFLHHPAQGVNDYRAVLDWIYDNLSWVQKEGPRSDRDIVAGAAGGSYGGGFQLLTAAFDDRLDAIAPVVTWNSLVQSLAPNGVPKSALAGIALRRGESVRGRGPPDRPVVRGDHGNEPAAGRGG